MQDNTKSGVTVMATPLIFKVNSYLLITCILLEGTCRFGNLI